MTRTLTLCVAALLTVSPAFAQSVTVSAPQTQALSPTLGATESLPIVTPEEAAALIQVPVVETLPPSGEVSSTLGTTESLPVVTPALAETLSAQPTLESVAEPSVLDTLPRISAEDIATIAIDAPLSVDPSAPAAEQDVSLYVVEDGAILPAASWSVKDSETCTASGGVELPLPGDRIGCFKL